jgi:hypothetical protein
MQRIYLKLELTQFGQQLCFTQLKLSDFLQVIKMMEEQLVLELMGFCYGLQSYLCFHL